MPETLYSLSQQVYTDLVQAATHELLVETLLTELIARQQFGPITTNPTPSPVPTPAPSLALPLQQTASTHSSAQGSRQPTPSVELLNRQSWVSGVPGRDVFGQEKIADSARYFTCGNCSRRIAGNRFAVHIDRCLGGRARK